MYSCCFFICHVFHCTTDIIYNFMTVAPSTLLTQDWPVPKISLIVIEISLAKDRCSFYWVAHQMGCFYVISCFTVLSFWILRVLMIRIEAEEALLSVLSGQFHCHPQTCPINSCPDDVITNGFCR